jgi:cysteinyl-tRNA synthetase
MHNGFVDVDDEKMSKSLGNFFTIRDVLQNHRSEAIRYFVLSSHYRSPLNYSIENLAQARSALDRLYTSLRGVTDSDAEPDPQLMEGFRKAMDDDFNTAGALAVLQGLAGDLNKAKEAREAREGGDSDRQASLAATMKECGQVLGILNQEPDSWFKSRTGDEVDGMSDDDIDALIAARNKARDASDWGEADRIRDALTEAGVLLEDGPEGTTWKRN